MSQGGTVFEGNVNLGSGTSTVNVVASNLATPPATTTAHYQVTVPSGASKSYGYDGAGNMTGDGSKSYTWDALNHLVKVTYTGGASSEFSYDALGRRVKIVEKSSGGTVTETRHFVWDGIEIAEQRDASKALVKRYYPDGYANGTLAIPNDDEKFLYLTDHLGSVRGVYSYDEQSMSFYQNFDAYGRVTTVPGLDYGPADFGYTGHYFHAPSGLTLAPFRAYDPTLGRWISRDPLNEQGGINLYRYVSNRPVDLFDPCGLWPELGGIDWGSSEAWGNMAGGFAEGGRNSAGGIVDSFTFGNVKGAFGSDTCSSAYKTGQIGGAFSMTTLAAAGGAAAWGAAGLPTFSIGGTFGTGGFHAFYAVTEGGATTWMHAAGVVGAVATSEAAALAGFSTAANTLTGIPIVAPAAAAAVGVSAKNCVSGAVGAFGRGWGL
jgi:RHS repeat-associated protein